MAVRRSQGLALLFLAACEPSSSIQSQQGGLLGWWDGTLARARLSLGTPSSSVSTSSGWFTTGALATGRQGHTMTLLPSGQVLVVGGKDVTSHVLASAEIYDPATGRWSPTGSLITARGGHSATLLSSGKVLVVAGDGTGGPVLSAELYDPTTGTWSAAGSLPSGRTFHTATLLLSGEVLVVGGGNGNLITFADAYVYNPETGMWWTTGSLHHGRAAHTATRLPSGKVLIAGGRSALEFELDAELYDPQTGTWRDVGRLSFPRAGHTATLLPSGKVLAAAGAVALHDMVSSAEVYDPATELWSSTGSLVTGRYWHAANLLTSGKVLVVGGQDSAGMTTTAELYDAATGTWGSTGAPTAVGYQTATLLPSGSVLVAGGALGGPFAMAELYEPGTGGWRSTGAMAVERDFHTATLLPSGEVLVIGGRNSSGRLGQVEVYNPQLGTWRTVQSLITPRGGHCATLLPSGKVLVTGGDPEGIDMTASAELYDPVTETWRATSPMLTPRSGHTAILLRTGEVLVFGESLSNAELYDPVTEVWTETGSLSTGSRHYMATVLSSGKVLVAGGDAALGLLSRAEVYDPETRRWDPTGSLNEARSGGSATLLPSGKVLVVGGTRGSITDIFASAELYDPATGVWTATGSLNFARYAHKATLLPSGKVLVLGGIGNSARLASAELYDPATGMWSVTGSLAIDRYGHTETLLPSGNVLVAGGSTIPIRYLATAEIYEPTGAQDTWHPTVSSPGTRWRAGTNLTLSGERFLGLSEASGGSLQNSATNFPQVTLQALGRNVVTRLPGSNPSDTSVAIRAPSSVLPGYHLLYVTTNGITGGTIARINFPPVPQPQSVSTREDKPVTFRLACKDVDGDSCTVRIATMPRHGLLSVHGTDVTYTPALHYSGPDSFTFVADDGFESSKPGTISLTVASINQPPVAQSLSVRTSKDTEVAITLLATDSELTPLSYHVVTKPRLGSVSCSDHGSLCTYTPEAGSPGSDFFTYQANDGELDSNEAVVSITVTDTNHAPLASDVSATTTREAAVSITLSATDADDEELSYTVLTTPLHGRLSGDPPALTYTPMPGYIGIDSFTYQASDGAAPSNTATVVVQIAHRPPGGCGGCASSTGDGWTAACGLLLLLGWLSWGRRNIPRSRPMEDA